MRIDFQIVVEIVASLRKLVGQMHLTYNFRYPKQKHQPPKKQGGPVERFQIKWGLFVRKGLMYHTIQKIVPLSLGGPQILTDLAALC